MSLFTAPVLKAVTIFSGLGSSSKALRDLGFDVLPHDFMPEAVATLKANGFIDAEQIDVREIDWSRERYAGVEVLIGGPPCQPFSQAHKGDGRYDERDMIPEYIRAVRELKPRVFVMEEVKTLTWAKHKDYLAQVITDLEAEGYVVDRQVLDASDYFIGQARKRLFIVGRRIDGPRLPRVIWPVKSTTKRTMADTLGWDMYEAAKRNLLAPERAHVALQADLDWVYTRPAPTVVGSFRPDVAAKPGWRKPGDGPRQNTPGSVVTTLEERLLLQDMPADWIVCGSAAKRDLQVGNSVPCGLIRDIVSVNL